MNAISKLTGSTKLLLLALIITVLWYWSSEETNDITAPNTSHINTERTSDYSATNFTMTVMDKQGKPSQIIVGEKMFHYPDDDSTEILSATAEFIEPDENNWLATADQASTQGKGDDILLTGNVIITQKQNNDLMLTTEKLNLDTLNDTAYTDLPVTLTSPQGVTNSVGLHAALQDKTINLHSRVKGHYDAPPTD